MLNTSFLFIKADISPSITSSLKLLMYWKNTLFFNSTFWPLNALFWASLCIQLLVISFPTAILSSFLASFITSSPYTLNKSKYLFMVMRKSDFLVFSLNSWFKSSSTSLKTILSCSRLPSLLLSSIRTFSVNLMAHSLIRCICAVFAVTKSLNLRLFFNFWIALIKNPGMLLKIFFSSTASKSTSDC